MTDEHATGQWFIHTDGSWAAAETDRATGDVLIYEGGRHPIWSRLEDAARWWQRHDQPTIELFHLHVTADTNTFTMSTAGTAWTRPS